LGAKKDRGTGFSVFCPREKWGESQKAKEGGGGGEGNPPQPPLSLFGFRPIFRAGKKPKIPFFGLSLLPNPTETQATQVKWYVFSLIYS